MALSGSPVRRAAQDDLVGRASSTTRSGEPELATEGRVRRPFRGVARSGRTVSRRGL